MQAAGDVEIICILHERMNLKTIFDYFGASSDANF
jgi:hypothetical protein